VANLDDTQIATATGAAYSDNDDSDEATAPCQEGLVKKPKKPKVKKPKVTVAEATVLIDVENVVAHLFEISVRPSQTSRPHRIPVKNEIL
jgi:heme-binding NEAT domain protein